MADKNSLIFSVATLSLVFGFLASFSEVTTAAEQVGKASTEGRAVGAGEQGFVAVIVDGPPLKSNQVKSADHRPISRGMTCSECHTVTYDFLSTASTQFVTNFPQLSQQEIWNKIVALLPGRERFMLATARNNQPTATTVDMVLDKDERVLYVVSEVGTEKLLQIPENPAISAVHFSEKSWTLAEGGAKEWRSVQFKGTAEVIPSSDPRWYPAVVKYNLVRISRERAQRRFDLIRITPTQAYYFDTTLGGEQKSVYQFWKRN